MMSKKKRSVPKSGIVIVDDHPMMREGLAQLIAQEPGWELLGQAGTAHEALDLVGKLKPHLLIADITLPGKSGLELIKDVQVMHPETFTLVVSMHDEALYAERVLRAGAKGYVMKQEGGKRLLEAIRQVLGGQIAVSEKMASRILEIFSAGRTQTNSSPVQSLSDREFEVFQLIGKGSDVREIAEHLHISIKTAEVHRTNIKQKLKLKSIGELIRYAVRWVDSESGEKA